MKIAQYLLKAVPLAYFSRILESAQYASARENAKHIGSRQFKRVITCCVSPSATRWDKSLYHQLPIDLKNRSNGLSNLWIGEGLLVMVSSKLFTSESIRRINVVSNWLPCGPL